jgi:hypothetical protein
MGSIDWVSLAEPRIKSLMKDIASRRFDLPLAFAPYIAQLFRSLNFNASKVFSVRNSFTGVAATMLKRTGLLKERKLPTSNSISIIVSFENISQNKPYLIA